MSADTTTTIETLELPPPGVWKIDPAHSSVNFSARHLGLSKVRGRFDHFEGTVEVTDDHLASNVRVAIHTQSVFTGTSDRDAHLRSADFLDVENFPTMDFVSSKIDGEGRHYQLAGDLTIRGTTLPVTLDVEFEGVGPDPMGGGQRMAFSARTSINREDFGLTWNAPLATGQILVGKRVDIELEVSATTQPTESTEEIRDDASSS